MLGPKHWLSANVSLRMLMQSPGPTKSTAVSPSDSRSYVPFNSRKLYFNVGERATMLPTPDKAKGGISDVYRDLETRDKKLARAGIDARCLTTGE